MRERVWCPVSLLFDSLLRIILIQTEARRRVIAVAMATRSNEGLGKKGRGKMAKIKETGHYAGLGLNWRSSCQILNRPTVLAAEESTLGAPVST